MKINAKQILEGFYKRANIFSINWGQLIHCLFLFGFNKATLICNKIYLGGA